MAEFESSGIWVVKSIGSFRHDEIDHQSLGLPESLAREFDKWIEHYEGVLGDEEPYDQEWMVSKGRELAVRLKKHVGKDTTVLYSSEDNLPEDEVIED